MLADIAPTHIAWTPDRIAEPLDMACRTWKHPHAIAISQKFTFKSLLRDSRFRPDGQRPIDKAPVSEERRQALCELPSQRREWRPGSPPWRRGGGLRQVRPGRRGEPGAIGLSEPRFAAPRAKLPGLRRVDEMQHDRLDPAFEIEQEKVAHEVEARRKGRETPFERCVERVLLHERIAFRVVAQRLHHALGQLLGPPR